MDKNSIIGISIIVAIFIGWGALNKPSEEEQERIKRRNDSIALVKDQNALEQQQVDFERQTIQKELDSLKLVAKSAKLGDFGDAAYGENEYYTIENELIKLIVSTKGGRPYSVQLKEYQTYDSLPLLLFNGDSTVFGLKYYYDAKPIATNDLFFEAVKNTPKTTVISDKAGEIKFRLNSSETAYLEYVYSLSPNSYQVDMKINLVGLENLSSRSPNSIDLEWEIFSPKQERGWKNESMYTTAYFRPTNDDVDFFNSRTKKELQEESIVTQVDWIGYKDQFFSSVIMPEKPFSSAKIQSITMPEDGAFIKQFKSIVGLTYTNPTSESIPISFYFGPNRFKYLKKNYADLQLHDMVSVGKSVIRWINQYVIINIFDWLDNRIANYGIIILLLTLIIKMFLLPLTYRSYISQAKMRVVKPMVDEATAKIPKEKSMERQQATMAIYKKVGVSPMGGCLPMVLQMPILFAMFRFFPGSIELRQESFLWATDLSTYDDLIQWGTSIPLLGTHLSLFTVLMTITTIISMKTNSSAQMGDSGMPGMKTMMYIMPVTFLFVLNDFSAALTYYYLLANLITFGQNLLFKAFVNEEEVLKKLQAKKVKPKKKSKWQARIEEMQKLQQQQAKKRK
jgi:YidC/Oxa1 family membrane protein insertase